MCMLFQHLLFISLNLYRAKVHIRHREYIIIISYLKYITFSCKTQCFRLTNFEVLRHTVEEDKPT